MEWSMRGKPIFFVWLKYVGAPVNKAGIINMRQHHAFRLAGRARGVEDVSQARGVGNSSRHRWGGASSIEPVESFDEGNSRADSIYNNHRRRKGELLEFLTQTIRQA